MPPVARERALSARKNRSNTRSWSLRAIPMPRSVTAISMFSPRRRRLMDTSEPRGEYAIALDTRLASAVTNRACSPSIRKPLGSSVRTVISALSAGTLWREIASDTTVSTSTAPMSGNRSAPCSRDSSISSLTMSPSRLASTSTFSPNRRTVSGSSAEDSRASASTAMAPTGVLSSWLTLATKSRLVASIRAYSEWS